MIFRKWNATAEKGGFHRLTSAIGMSVLAFLLTLGSVGCKKEAEEAETAEVPVILKEGVNEFEGVVKVAQGKYLYLPSALGLDIIVQGQISIGSLGDLVDKEILVKGELLKDKPSLLVAQSIDVKDADGRIMNVFTKTEEVILEDYIDAKERESFPVLNITAHNKSEEWEGKGRAKIFGKLEKGAAEGIPVYSITISDEKGKEIGKVLVDSATDYALYYIKKLWLFDKFWCYVSVKETVDWKVRRTSKELFHADLLFVGLF